MRKSAVLTLTATILLGTVAVNSVSNVSNDSSVYAKAKTSKKVAKVYTTKGLRDDQLKKVSDSFENYLGSQASKENKAVAKFYPVGAVATGQFTVKTSKGNLVMLDNTGQASDAKTTVNGHNIFLTYSSVNGNKGVHEDDADSTANMWKDFDQAQPMTGYVLSPDGHVYNAKVNMTDKGMAPWFITGAQGTDESIAATYTPVTGKLQKKYQALLKAAQPSKEQVAKAKKIAKLTDAQKIALVIASGKVDDYTDGSERVLTTKLGDGTTYYQMSSSKTEGFAIGIYFEGTEAYTFAAQGDPSDPAMIKAGNLDKYTKIDLSSVKASSKALNNIVHRLTIK
ncbi:hypothetical protein LA429_03370 [Weissella cibaria]|uniref:hypothetical protein n=1 Tax=Weissella cibaria TaxID=137591 RepID=UPI001E40477B|nr:hypothetical protein [Weissella cibaria]MCC6121776.1 hypothetical protein [Weissella cibaria]MCT0952897.1 hypothetical protein [Weissella cibaria]